MSEFNLSEHIIGEHVIGTEDVKEFIKRLKEQAQWNLSGIIGQSITAELHDLIDKLAGEKLI